MMAALTVEHANAPLPLVERWRPLVLQVPLFWGPSPKRELFLSLWSSPLPVLSSHVTSPCRGHDGGPLVESCLRILSLTVEPCFLDCLLGGAVGRATSYLSRWSSLLAHPFLPYLFSISEERRWPAVLSEGRRENAPRGRDYEDISPFFTPPPAALDILIYPGLAEDPEGLRPPSALRSAEAFSLYYKE